METLFCRYETGVRACASGYGVSVWPGVRSTRAALGAWRTVGLRPVNTEWTEARGGTESGFEVGLRAVSPRGVLLGRVFFTTEHTETPFGRHRRGRERRCFARSGLFLPCRGTCKTIAIAVATSEPLRKSVNRCCFAKIREGCACRSRGFATNPCRLLAA